LECENATTKTLSIYNWIEDLKVLTVTKPTMFHHFFNHSTLKAMGRRKTLAEAQENDGGNGGLRRSLTAIDLILYGVGSSVGAGIFVLVGL
jgi:hypothetical protein